MFGFRRNKVTPEDQVAASLLGIAATLVKDTSIALKEWVQEDWVNTVGARFELGVYNLFKIDYAGCRRLSEQDRGKLMDRCEHGLALSFANSELGATREQIFEVIAVRMAAYGERAQGQKEVVDLTLSLINGLCVYLQASGTRNRIEADPAFVVPDFMVTSSLTAGLIACEKNLGGFDFWKFALDLFKSHPQIFSLSGAQITETWEQYRAAGRTS